MPLLKLKHIVSSSSEDLKHPAENLLKPETYYKWKCATPGERQVSVVIQLEKSTKIHSVDIGNNGSAFVEVLVGRSSWGPSEEFKVLLVASSFMSPMESKNNKELFRVRMFGVENFTKAASEEKWDLVKLVCTQPYNQNEPYGLSFVTIHSQPEEVEKKKENKTIQLGRFKLRSNSDSEEDTITSGSWFHQKKIGGSTDTPNKTMAAACRDAGKTSQQYTLSPLSGIKTKGEATPTAKIGISNECRNKVAEDLLKNQSPSTPTSSRIFPKMKETPKAEKTKRKVDETAATTKQKPPPKKSKVEEKPVKKKKKKIKTKTKDVPYNKILDKVVFCLSGFENPERGQLRDAALKMGAEYSPSWTNRCTHLICHFMNTPKFHQVKGRGKIVKKEWIKQCHKQRKKLNTKSFRMDGGGDSSYESTDEEEEENEDMNQPTTSQSQVVERILNDKQEEEIEKERKKSTSSECDTEDELEKLRNENSAIQTKKGSTVDETSEINKANDVDPYDCSTDEENDVGDEKNDEVHEPKQTSKGNEDKDATNNLSQSMELPDFLEDKYFLIYGSIETQERRLLRRYITAYGGTLVDYMGPKVNYVISNDNWDENFDEAYKENNSLIFIRPSWIIKCHEEQTSVDITTYYIKVIIYIFLYTTCIIYL